MITIYHNPRCAKSRAGLKYLVDNNIEHQIIQYLKEKITAEDIKILSAKTGLKPKELVRTQEDYFKKNLKGKDFSDSEWYKIIAENPKLLQRPIVVNNNKAVLAQPPEKIKEII
jgi:arsenate reductase (glutaredoxin)